MCCLVLCIFILEKFLFRSSAHLLVVFFFFFSFIIGQISLGLFLDTLLSSTDQHVYVFTSNLLFFIFIA